MVLDHKSQDQGDQIQPDDGVMKRSVITLFLQWLSSHKTRNARHVEIILTDITVLIN